MKLYAVRLLDDHDAVGFYWTLTAYSSKSMRPSTHTMRIQGHLRTGVPRMARPGMLENGLEGSNVRWKRGGR
jgi:hypothetical protein